MTDDTAVFQFHFTHQRTYRLFKRQIVKLARTQTTKQSSHRVVNPQRQLFYQLAALPYAGVVWRQTLHDPRLGANCRDRLADIIMELARHVTPHALFRFQQTFRQPPISRQLVL